MSKKYNYFDDEQNTDIKNKSSLKTNIEDFFEHFQSKKSKFSKSNIKRAFDKDVFVSNKKIITVICIAGILLAVILFTVIFALKLGSETSKTDKFNADAGDVCAKYAADFGNCSYERIASSDVESGYRMTGICYARQLDFDDDSNSELLIAYRDNGIYYCDIWGYKDDDFISLYHQKAAQTTDSADDVWITLYYSHDKYYIGNHTGDNFENVDLYSLKGSDFEKKKTAKYNSKSQKFEINEKNGNFETIRLSVLTESRASRTVEEVSEIINSFTRSSNADTIHTTNALSLNDAYYELVSSYNKEYGEATLVSEGTQSYIDGLAVADLVDFNADGTDELILIYRKAVKTRGEDKDGNYISKTQYKFNCDIYTYNGSAAKLIYQSEGVSNTLSDTSSQYFMLKKQNGKQYICSNTFETEDYGRYVKATSSIHSYNGKTFEKKYDSAYETQYGYTHYYLNGERVYTSEFEKDGYSVPFFDGSENYDDNLYTVMYLQGSSSKSQMMQQVINTTKYTINSLSTT